MPPKPSPGRNVPTNNPSSRGAPSKSSPTRGVKGGTRKKAKGKQKGPRLKLKGWLKTQADWAKFDAWAKINAQPRKIQEPEPVVRESKPLSKLKKRIAVLSTPHKQSDVKTCRSDLGVSKKALTAKPSKRVIQLAMFVVKNIEACREPRISRAALRYRATERIIEISRPREIHFSEYCKLLATSQGNEETNGRARRLALAKKAIECPMLMTDEEMNILMTPTGIYRSALEYKFTPWMTYLALPSYRFLKDQAHERAEEWKKLILQENETRGKKALEYKRAKRDEMAKRREEKERLEREKIDAGNNEKQPATGADVGEDDNGKEADAPTEENAEERADETNETAASATVDGQRASATKDEKKDEGIVEDDEAAERRKAERNAWRFAPSPCKDNPFEIKRSALKGKVSPRMDELAKHHVHVNKSCRKKPFDVRKSALNGPIPPRIPELAKPSHPRDPVERTPPRDKDPFGRPIFPMPPYGKKMPRVKPYKEAECPAKDEKVDDEEDARKKKEENRRRVIDPIVYEPTIDPCIDPDRAKRQLKARKAAKEELERRKKVEEATAKENEPSNPDNTG